MTTQLGLTLNVIAQFAWHKLIQVYTGDTQTIVGTVVSGRALPIADLACSVGPYVNTLPLIITWNASSTIQEQLKAIHEHIDRLNIHAMTDLSSLQKDGQRLFHSLLTFDNYPGLGEDVSESQGLVAHACGGIEKVDYPFSLVVHTRDDGLHLELAYDETYLVADKAKHVLGQLQRILQQLPDKLLESHHNEKIYLIQ